MRGKPRRRSAKSSASGCGCGSSSRAGMRRRGGWPRRSNQESAQRELAADRQLRIEDVWLDQWQERPAVTVAATRSALADLAEPVVRIDYTTLPADVRAGARRRGHDRLR